MFERMYQGLLDMKMFFQIEDSFSMKMPEKKEGCGKAGLEDEKKISRELFYKLTNLQEFFDDHI